MKISFSSSHLLYPRMGHRVDDLALEDDEEHQIRNEHQERTRRGDTLTLGTLLADEIGEEEGKGAE